MSQYTQASLALAAQPLAAHTRLKLPRIAPVPSEGNEWVLLEDYAYVMPPPFWEGALYLPRGLRTDLASVPRIFWPVIAPFQLSALAPILHDLPYACKGRLPEFIAPQGHNLTRWDADELFMIVMEQEGVSNIRREIAYRGVRWFGGPAWGRRSLRIDVPLAEQMLSCIEEDDLGWPDR